MRRQFRVGAREQQSIADIPAALVADVAGDTWSARRLSAGGPASAPPADRISLAVVPGSAGTARTAQPVYEARRRGEGLQVCRRELRALWANPVRAHGPGGRR